MRLTTRPGYDFVLVIEVAELKDVLDDLNEELALLIRDFSRDLLIASSSMLFWDKSWFAAGMPDFTEAGVPNIN